MINTRLMVINIVLYINFQNICKFLPEAKMTRRSYVLIPIHGRKTRYEITRVIIRKRNRRYTKNNITFFLKKSETLCTFLS